MNDSENRWRAEMHVLNGEKSALLAIGKVILDDNIVINNVKLVQIHNKDGKAEWVVSLPRKQVTVNGELVWKPLFTLDTKTRKAMEQAVFDGIKEELGRGMTMSRRDIQINVIPREGDGNIRGEASLSYEGILNVHGIRIMDGKNGLFVVYPTAKGKDDVYKPLMELTAFIAKNELDSRILRAYESSVRKIEKAITPSAPKR